jgi:hypothetical protein
MYSVGSDDYIDCYVDIKTGIDKRKALLEKLNKTIMDIPVRQEIADRFRAFCTNYESQNVNRGAYAQASLENALLNWMDNKRKES